MIKLPFLWHGLAWLSVAGMCLPFSAVVAKEVSATAARPSEAARPGSMGDIALGQGGLLVGQILDDTLQPVRGAAVEIQVDGRTAASTVTDANGVFAVAALRGGVHQVAAQDSVGSFRLWAPGTAPPSAAEHLRFIPGQNKVIRGQWSPPSSEFTDHLQSWATNPWVIAGVVVAAIAVPVAMHNLDDDEDNGS